MYPGSQKYSSIAPLYLGAINACSGTAGVGHFASVAARINDKVVSGNSGTSGYPLVEK